MTRDKIDEWVMVIRMGVDPGSPFDGMIDLSDVLDLPLADQHEIFAALPQDIQDRIASAPAANPA